MEILGGTCVAWPLFPKVVFLTDPLLGRLPGFPSVTLSAPHSLESPFYAGPASLRSRGVQTLPQPKKFK